MERIQLSSFISDPSTFIYFKKSCTSRNELETSKFKPTIDMENPSRMRFSLEGRDYLTSSRNYRLLAFRTWSVIFSEKGICPFPSGGCQELPFP